MPSLPLSRRLERLPELYVPYVGHTSDDVVLLNDGSLMAMVRLQGAPFELVAPLVRKNRALALNDLLRRLPVDAVTIHLVKHEVAETRTPPECGTAYGRGLMAKYRDVVLGQDVRAISWFIALIVRPSTPGFLRRASDQQDHDAAERLEHGVRTLMGTLSEHAPKRLGRRDMPTDMPGETVTMSEIGSALYLIRTGIEQDVPETAGPLGSAVLPTSPLFGKRAFDLCIPGTPRYGAMVSLKDYPSRTRAGMLNELLSADFSFSLTQGFSYENGRMNEAKLAFREVQMSNTGSRSETLSAGLKKLADDTSSNRTTTGMHNFALAVFSPRLDDLDRHVGSAMTAITRFGGPNPVKERNVWWSGGMEPQYWALLPGVTWTHCRSGQITTLNLAHMASLEGFASGSARGYWGKAPIRLRTRAGTAFDYIPTVDDVGHTAIFGATGSGKTVVLSMLKTAMDAVLGETGLRLLIDKDGSNRISVEMEGGAYATFRRNEVSGVAPLRFFDDTPRNRAFFHGLYSWLITCDGQGGLAPDEDRRLARGIARQLKMPKHLRSMSGVREFLGYSDPVRGAGARFERWCAGGSMGWLLDGDVHLVDLDPSKARLYGFDFSALLPKEGENDDGACQAAAAVIAHQLGDYIDGRRIMFICEEARFYLEPLAKLIDDLTLTGRKNELMVMLVAQQPEHFLDAPIGLSLMAQCRTKLFFPSKSADRDTYLNRVGISPKAFEQLSHGMFVGNAGRRFLLWRGEDESAICEFDLSAMPDEVAIMSARARTNHLLDQIKAETGRPLPPAELRSEFLRRNARHLKLQEAA